MISYPSYNDCYSFILFFLLFDGLTDLSFKLIAKLWIISKQVLCGVTALCKLRTIIAKPASTLLNYTIFNAKIEDFSYLTDSFSE